MHYNFVEIGTSDFDALIQTCSDDAVGLSIEPMKVYLDNLPDRPRVKKINAAISDDDTVKRATIYFVQEEDIRKYELPEWVRGCNCIGLPHPFVLQAMSMLRPDVPVNAVYKQAEVTCLPIASVWEEHAISTLDHLKIDTEGMDCQIFFQLAKHLDGNGRPFPRKVQVEVKHCKPKDIVDLHQLLRDRGYAVEFVENDIVGTMADAPGDAPGDAPAKPPLSVQDGI